MGLFDNDKDNGPTTSTGCPLPLGVQRLTVVGHGHRALYIISAVSAIFTLISSVGLILMHLFRYRAPKEQRQIVRIAWMPFIFAVVAWAEVADYTIAPYLDPIGEVYESWAIPAIYLLFIQYTAPGGTFSEDMFQAMANASETGQGKAGWPKLSWLLVFQYPVTELIAVIILEATEAEGTYCINSLKPKYGHLWTQIIRLVGLVLAAMTVIRFYGRMKKMMKTHRGLFKLIGFKGFIFLHFIQTWVFSILISRDVLHHSDEFSYGDLLYGLPNTIFAVETAIFSAFFWYAFAAGEYSGKYNRGKKYNFFYAIAHALNPSDLVKGIFRAIGLLLGRTSGSSPPPYYGDASRLYKPVGSSGYDSGSHEPLAEFDGGYRESGYRQA